MYISQTFSYKPRKDLQIYCPKKLESVFIELTIPNKPNFFVGAMYKHPSMQHYEFNNDFLQNLLNKIQTEKKFSVLAGDFNLNLIKYSKTTDNNQFLEIILSHNFMPQITLSTRATGRTATLIDNTLINSYENKCSSGNITNSVSHHLPQFLFIENIKGQTYKIKNPKAIIRDYKNFNSESFQSDIKEIDWSLATENNDVDLGFETFFKIFSRTLDKHAPCKEIRKKMK